MSSPSLSSRARRCAGKRADPDKDRGVRQRSVWQHCHLGVCGGSRYRAWSARAAACHGRKRPGRAVFSGRDRWGV